MIKAEGGTHAVRSLLPSAPPNPKNKQPECLSSADCDFGDGQSLGRYRFDYEVNGVRWHLLDAFLDHLITMQMPRSSCGMTSEESPIIDTPESSESLLSVQ